MKVLLLDLETSPSAAYVWSLFKTTIPITSIIESSEVLCWSAKWYGSDEVLFDSIHKSSRKRMLRRIHKLLSDADAVVHYNGNRFDIPTLNKEFLIHGFTPPAPAKQIDLYRTVKTKFRFVSNKLDYVSKMLGLGEKTKTDFTLWVQCMNKNSEAWSKMEEYNKQDVLLLEKLYDRLRGWIRSCANWGLYLEPMGQIACPNCGSLDHQRRGFSYTGAYKYQRHRCKGCGNWFRSGKNLGPKPGEKAINV